MFKIVFKNTVFQVLGKIFTAGSTLVITLLIGKSLGPEGYGEFTKIFAFIGYFYILSDFGINSIYVKLATQDESHQARLLSSLVLLRLILGIIFAAIASSIALVLPYNPVTSTGFSPLVKVSIFIASLTIISQALLTTANAYFQKILRFDLSSIAAIFGSFTILAVAILATFNKTSIIGYTIAYVVGGLVFIITAYFLILGKLKFVSPGSYLKEDILKLFSQAWPIGIALVANLIYFRIDVFILANFRTTEEVGLYGLSYQFFEATLAIPIFFANSIFPLLTDLYHGNKAEFLKQLRKWQKFLTGISLVLSLALVLVANLIPLIYDARFQGSVLSLQILALGLPFFFMTALFWHILIIYNRQKYLTVIYIVGALFNLLLNIILIPTFGYLAAATNTLISEIIITTLLFWAIRKQKHKMPAL